MTRNALLERPKLKPVSKLPKMVIFALAALAILTVVSFNRRDPLPPLPRTLPRATPQASAPSSNQDGTVEVAFQVASATLRPNSRNYILGSAYVLLIIDGQEVIPNREIIGSRFLPLNTNRTSEWAQSYPYSGHGIEITVLGARPENGDVWAQLIIRWEGKTIRLTSGKRASHIAHINHPPDV